MSTLLLVVHPTATHATVSTTAQCSGLHCRKERKAEVEGGHEADNQQCCEFSLSRRKSTTIQLLERFYDPDKGEILVNGISQLACQINASITAPMLQIATTSDCTIATTIVTARLLLMP